MKLKRKPSKRKKYIIALDKLFSQFIRERDKNKCFTCGTTENPTCGHLFTRACYSTRWEERNAQCQCSGCNFRHEFNPHIFTNAYINKYGLIQYQKMYAQHARSHKYTQKELEQMLEQLKQKLCLTKPKL